MTSFDALSNSSLPHWETLWETKWYGTQTKLNVDIALKGDILIRTISQNIFQRIYNSVFNQHWETTEEEMVSAEAIKIDASKSDFLMEIEKRLIEKEIDNTKQKKYSLLQLKVTLIKKLIHLDDSLAQDPSLIITAVKIDEALNLNFNQPQDEPQTDRQDSIFEVTSQVCDLKDESFDDFLPDPVFESPEESSTSMFGTDQEEDLSSETDEDDPSPPFQDDLIPSIPQSDQSSLFPQINQINPLDEIDPYTVELEKLRQIRTKSLPCLRQFHEDRTTIQCAVEWYYEHIRINMAKEEPSSLEEVISLLGKIEQLTLDSSLMHSIQQLDPLLAKIIVNMIYDETKSFPRQIELACKLLKNHSESALNRLETVFRKAQKILDRHQILLDSEVKSNKLLDTTPEELRGNLEKINLSNWTPNEKLVIELAEQLLIHLQEPIKEWALKQEKQVFKKSRDANFLELKEEFPLLTAQNALSFLIDRSKEVNQSGFEEDLTVTLGIKRALLLNIFRDTTLSLIVDEREKFPVFTALLYRLALLLKKADPNFLLDPSPVKQIHTLNDQDVRLEMQAIYEGASQTSEDPDDLRSTLQILGYVTKKTEELHDLYSELTETMKQVITLKNEIDARHQVVTNRHQKSQCSLLSDTLQTIFNKLKLFSTHFLIPRNILEGQLREQHLPIDRLNCEPLHDEMAPDTITAYLCQLKQILDETHTKMDDITLTLDRLNST
jgi:hypothetical protein